MDPGAVGRDVPNGRGDGAENHLCPDAGNDGGHAFAAIRVNPGLGDVGKKRRREVNKVEAHAVHVPAIVLAGEAVRRFMKEQNETGQQPKFRNVVQAFFGEVVKLQGIAADLAPAHEKDVAHQHERGDGEQGKPAAVNPFQIGINAVEIFVGIPGGELQMRNIAVF